jgi:hypothetical protein
MNKQWIAIAALAAAPVALAAEINFAALLQRLPAWPANLAAVAKIKAGGNVVASKLEDDLKQASTQLALDEQNRVTAGTGLEVGADPAQAQARMQAMAAQMQGMSQQQQIAMALQMQQQIQSNLGVQSAIMTPAETQAFSELNQQRMHVNEFNTQLNQLNQRQIALRSAIDAQHQQISNALQKSVDALNATPTNSQAACEARTRQQKQLRIDAFNRQVVVADKLVAQTQPPYADYRKLAEGERLRLDRSLVLAAKIKNGAMRKQAAGIVASARQNTLGATQAVLSPYNSVQDEAHWLADRDNAMKDSTDCGGGG